MNRKDDLEFSISTEDKSRVYVSPYHDNSVWLSLCFRGGSAYLTLTNDEAKKVLEALQKVVEFNENAHADA